MALQKEAFQLVIGFMMEGLGTKLGGMVDILATMATSRDERHCSVALASSTRSSRPTGCSAQCPT